MSKNNDNWAKKVKKIIINFKHKFMIWTRNKVAVKKVKVKL